MEPCFYLEGNERSSGRTSSGTNYMAKHSSNISNYNPSKPILSFILGLKTLSAEEVSKQGMSLRPRLVQDTLRVDPRYELRFRVYGETLDFVREVF